MSRLYTRVACDRCGDMYEILKDEVGDRFVCNRCGLRAQATDSSDFWYEQSLAGWKSAARLNELLKSKEADLENERRAGDAMQAELERLESRWVSRLHAWLRGVWRYNIYCETCVKGED